VVAPIRNTAARTGIPPINYGYIDKRGQDHVRLRAPVGPTDARRTRPLICVGHIDRMPLRVQYIGVHRTAARWLLSDCRWSAPITTLN
jgi:hypothetical protein